MADRETVSYLSQVDSGVCIVNMDCAQHLSSDESISTLTHIDTKTNVDRDENDEKSFEITFDEVINDSTRENISARTLRRNIKEKQEQYENMRQKYENSEKSKNILMRKCKKMKKTYDEHIKNLNTRIISLETDFHNLSQRNNILEKKCATLRSLTKKYKVKYQKSFSSEDLLLRRNRHTPKSFFKSHANPMVLKETSSEDTAFISTANQFVSKSNNKHARKHGHSGSNKFSTISQNKALTEENKIENKIPEKFLGIVNKNFDKVSPTDNIDTPEKRSGINDRLIIDNIIKYDRKGHIVAQNILKKQWNNQFSRRGFNKQNNRGVVGSQVEDTIEQYIESNELVATEVTGENELTLTNNNQDDTNNDKNISENKNEILTNTLRNSLKPTFPIPFTQTTDDSEPETNDNTVRNNQDGNRPMKEKTEKPLDDIRHQTTLQNSKKDEKRERSGTIVKKDGLIKKHEKERIITKLANDTEKTFSKGLHTEEKNTTTQTLNRDNMELIHMYLNSTTSISGRNDLNINTLSKQTKLFLWQNVKTLRKLLIANKMLSNKIDTLTESYMILKRKKQEDEDAFQREKDKSSSVDAEYKKQIIRLCSMVDRLNESAEGERLEVEHYHVVFRTLITCIQDIESMCETVVEKSDNKISLFEQRIDQLSSKCNKLVNMEMVGKSKKKSRRLSLSKRLRRLSGGGGGETSNSMN